MNIALSYIAVGLLTLASAAVVAGGGTAEAELRFAEAATSAGASSDGFGWLTAAAMPETSGIQ
jgi:hypothetical protein